MAEIASTIESETAAVGDELVKAKASLENLEKRVTLEKRKALVCGALKASGMTSELAMNWAADMLVSEGADENDTLDEEIKKLKLMDPAAFAPVPAPKSQLPAFSCATPETKLPDASPLFENGTPLFSFLRRPTSNC